MPHANRIKAPIDQQYLFALNETNRNRKLYYCTDLLVSKIRAGNPEPFANRFRSFFCSFAHSFVPVYPMSRTLLKIFPQNQRLYRFGQKNITFELPKEHMHFIQRIFLRIKSSGPSVSRNLPHRFCERLGERLLESVTFTSDNVEISRYSNLSASAFNFIEPSRMYDRCIGNTFELKSSKTEHPPLDLIVPLQFWFCDPLSSVWTVSKDKKEIVTVDFADIEDLVAFDLSSENNDLNLAPIIKGENDNEIVMCPVSVELFVETVNMDEVFQKPYMAKNATVCKKIVEMSTVFSGNACSKVWNNNELLAEYAAVGIQKLDNPKSKSWQRGWLNWFRFMPLPEHESISIFGKKILVSKQKDAPLFKRVSLESGNNEYFQSDSSGLGMYVVPFKHAMTRKIRSASGKGLYFIPFSIANPNRINTFDLVEFAVNEVESEKSRQNGINGMMLFQGHTKLDVEFEESILNEQDQQHVLYLFVNSIEVYK